jgi:hypothetical protein
MQQITYPCLASLPKAPDACWKEDNGVKYAAENAGRADRK